MRLRVKKTKMLKNRKFKMLECVEKCEKVFYNNNVIKNRLACQKTKFKGETHR